MLVDVVSVLVVAMSVMNVVDVTVVLHSLATVVFGVHSVVTLVDHFLAVVLPVMNVVDVTIVLHSLMTIAGQVLMISWGMLISHRASLAVRNGVRQRRTAAILSS